MNVQSSASDAIVIEIGNALDFRNAANFKALCLSYIDAGKRNFVLDFSETGILDSTGLGAIFALYRQVTKMNGHVVFAAASRPVEVVVQLTRTHKVFPQYPTVRAALDAIQRAEVQAGEEAFALAVN